MTHTQKVRLAIKGLMSGYSITVDGTVYRMSEDFDLVFEADSYTVRDGVQTDNGKQYLPTYMTVSTFIQICGHMTDAELIGITAQLVLNNDG